MSKDINNNFLPNLRIRGGRSRGRGRGPPQRYSQYLSHFSQEHRYNRFGFPDNFGSIRPFEHYDFFNPQAYQPVADSMHLSSLSLTDTSIWREATRDVYSPMDIQDDPRLSSSGSNNFNSGVNFNVDMSQSWALSAHGGIGGSNWGTQCGGINRSTQHRETSPGPSRFPHQRGQTRLHSRKRPIENENAMEVVDRPPALETTGDNQQQDSQAMDTCMGDGTRTNDYFVEKKRSRYGKSLFAPPRLARRYPPHPQRSEDATNREGGEGIGQAVSSQDSQPPRQEAPLERNVPRYYELPVANPAPEGRERQSRPRLQRRRNQVRQRSESFVVDVELNSNEDEIMAHPTDNFNSEGGAGAP